MKKEIKETLKNEFQPYMLALKEQIKSSNEILNKILQNEKEFPDKLNVKLSQLQNLTLVSEKGDKGDTPIFGVDFLKPDEMLQIKKEVTPIVGHDYFTEKDIKAFLKKVTPKRGIDYKDGKDGKDGKDAEPVDYAYVIRMATPIKGRDYKDGIDGKAGKDGTQITPEQVRDKLESLVGGSRLSVRAIKGIEEFVSSIVTTSSKRDTAVIQSGSPNATWGAIQGDVTTQTDLVAYIDSQTAGDSAWTISGTNVYLKPAYTKLGIGTILPTHSLTFDSTSTGISLYNTADQVTNYERVTMTWGSNIFDINSNIGGSGTTRSLRMGSGSLNNYVINFGASDKHVWNATTGATTGQGYRFNGSYTASSGVYTHVSLLPTINMSSTGGYTAFLINPTETATGSGTKLLIDVQIGGNSKFKVTNNGDLTSVSGTASQSTFIHNVNSTGVAAGNAIFRFIRGTSGTNINIMGIDTAGGASTSSSGMVNWLAIQPTINQSSTAGYTGILINPTETTLGSGVNSLILAQVGGSTKFSISNTGVGYFSGNVSMGVTSASAALHVVSTTEQLRVGYDTSNYFNATVSSTGVTTLDGAGSGAAFSFSKSVGLGTTAPSSPLTIRSTGNNQIHITDTGDSSTIGLDLGFDDTANTIGYIASVYNDNGNQFDIRMKGKATTDAKLTVLGSGLVGIGTTAPTHSLTFPSTGTGIALYNTVDQTTNYDRAAIYWSSNQLIIETTKGGTGASRNLLLQTAGGGSMSISGSTGVFTFSKSASTGVDLYNFAGSQSNSSGTMNVVVIKPTINQSSTGGYSALSINPTETATGSGTKRLISAQVGGSDRFSVRNDGVTFLGAYATASAPTYTLGGMYFDTTLNKLMIGGATAWETVTSA